MRCRPRCDPWAMMQHQHEGHAALLVADTGNERVTGGRWRSLDMHTADAGPAVRRSMGGVDGGLPVCVRGVDLALLVVCSVQGHSVRQLAAIDGRARTKAGRGVFVP